MLVYNSVLIDSEVQKFHKKWLISLPQDLFSDLALQIWNIFLRIVEEAELAQGEESELIADRLS